MCPHCTFIPADKSDSRLWICISQCFPRLMIFLPFKYIHLPHPFCLSFFLSSYGHYINTHTRDTSTDPSPYVQSANKQLAFYEPVPSGLYVLLCRFSSQVPTNDLKQDLNSSTWSYRTGGAQGEPEGEILDNKRNPRTMLQRLVGRSRPQFWKVRCHAIAAALHSGKTAVSGQTTPYWSLLGGSEGQEETLLKIKGSGDVKVVSWVIRHRRFGLRATTSSRLGRLIYLLTDFMCRHFPRWLTAQAYASQVNFKGRGKIGAAPGCPLALHGFWRRHPRPVKLSRAQRRSLFVCDFNGLEARL